MFAVVLVAAVVLPGCLGDKDPQATPESTPAQGPSPPDAPASTDPAPPPVVPRPTKLVALTERAPVSGDHRVGEFAVARSPLDAQRLVLAGYDLDSTQGAAFCTAFVSADGGLTWTRSEPVPGDVGGWGGDPWVAIAPNGDVHLACLTVSTVNGASTYLYTSADGATSWDPPIVVEGVTDKEAVFAASTGDVFICGSTRGPDGNSLGILRSTDRGRTFAAPLLVPGRNNCNGIVEGPAGELHLVWLAVDGETRVVGTMTSVDHGLTWRDPVRVAAHPYPNEFTNPDYPTSSAGTYTRPTGNWPNLAVSPRSGAVLFATDRDDLDDGTSGVKVRISNDGGSTYALLALPPVPTALADVVHSRPTMAFDDAGNLGLQLMANGGPAFAEREIWFLASPDDGVTWLPPLLVASTDSAHSRLDPRAHAPNSNAAPGQAMYVLNHPDYADTTFTQSALLLANSQQLEWGGDYGALAASPRGFVALWQDFAEEGELRTYSRVIGLQ